MGCGNGKYLNVNRDVFIVASDRSALHQWAEKGIDCDLQTALVVFNRYCRSEALVKIAVKHEAHSALVADNLMLPHPAACFDFAISVAVIHHLSTTSRRIQAIAAILETLKRCSPGTASGKALICVWALEQQQSRRGWGEHDEQDVMVPWIMKEQSSGPVGATQRTFHRYYHLYRAGELQQDISAAGGTTVQSGYEKDNWWAIAMRSDNDVIRP